MNPIKKTRQKLGISQVELANYLEVEQPFISAIESGDKQLSVEKLILVAEYFGSTVDELLGREADLDQSLMNRFKKIQSMPKKKKDLLLKSIDMLIAGAD